MQSDSQDISLVAWTIKTNWGITKKLVQSVRSTKRLIQNHSGHLELQTTRFKSLARNCLSGRDKHIYWSWIIFHDGLKSLLFRGQITTNRGTLQINFLKIRNTRGSHFRQWSTVCFLWILKFCRKPMDLNIVPAVQDILKETKKWNKPFRISRDCWRSQLILT